MPSLLLLIFLLQLTIHLINTIGARTINDLLWHLTTSYLPSSSSSFLSRQHHLRASVLRLKRELNTTSSQDEFAKWAKLRRQHDKAQAEYDEVASKTASARSSFDLRASSVRWALTNGLRLALQFYHSGTPVFEIPRGWAPAPVEWVLGWPRVKRGGVSLQVWGWACAAVIGLVGETVTAVWVWRNGGGEAVGEKGNGNGNGREGGGGVDVGEVGR